MQQAWGDFTAANDNLKARMIGHAFDSMLCIEKDDIIAMYESKCCGQYTK